jgi:hypothetical protein
MVRTSLLIVTWLVHPHGIACVGSPGRAAAQLGQLNR